MCPNLVPRWPPASVLVWGERAPHSVKFNLVIVELGKCSVRRYVHIWLCSSETMPSFFFSVRYSLVHLFFLVGFFWLTFPFQLLLLSVWHACRSSTLSIYCLGWFRLVERHASVELPFVSALALVHSIPSTFLLLPPRPPTIFECVDARGRRIA